MKREKFTTTLDPEVIRYLKVQAVSEKTDANIIIERLVRKEMSKMEKVILYAAPAKNPNAGFMDLLDATPHVSLTEFPGLRPAMEIDAESAPVTQWSAEQDSEETTVTVNGKRLTVGGVLSAIKMGELPYRALDEDLVREIIR